MGMDTEQDKLVYEDQLPEMTDSDYSAWFAKSQIVDGVRMGPPVNHRVAAFNRRVEAEKNYNFFRKYLGMSRI